MSSPPAWVTGAVGESAPVARRARWGFRNETWIVEPTAARPIVVQRRVDGSDPTGPHGRAIRELVRSAGLPTPEPTRIPAEGADVVVSLPYVDGVVGAELLGTREGAMVVGDACGLIAARIGVTDPGDASLPRTWASGRGLRTAAARWMDTLPASLQPRVHACLVASLERVAREADAAAPRLAHGDLAPVNVLLKGNRLAAVLDLDRVQVAHPLYDAAWFAWVVSFHHGELADAAWAAFARASGVTAGLGASSTAAVAWLWPLLLLERLAEAGDAHERATWMERIEATAALTAGG